MFPGMLRVHIKIHRNTVYLRKRCLYFVLATRPMIGMFYCRRIDFQAQFGWDIRQWIRFLIHVKNDGSMKMRLFKNVVFDC